MYFELTESSLCRSLSKSLGEREKKATSDAAKNAETVSKHKMINNEKFIEMSAFNKRV
jgi:hypothetical protein